MSRISTSHLLAERIPWLVKPFHFSHIHLTTYHKQCLASASAVAMLGQWFIPGLKHYHVQSLAAPTARTDHFKLIQRGAHPLRREVRPGLGLIQTDYIYLYQGTAAGPYCITVQHLVVDHHEHCYLYGFCTCAFSASDLARPDGPWCKHVCALALLLVDKSDEVGMDVCRADGQQCDAQIHIPSLLLPFPNSHRFTSLSPLCLL